MQFSFALRRDTLDQNDDKKSDRDMCIEWLRTAYASSQTQSDPLLHLLWNTLLEKMASTEGDSVNLSQQEFIMIKLTLIRANFNAAGNNVYCQLLRKVGIDIE